MWAHWEKDFWSSFPRQSFIRMSYVTLIKQVKIQNPTYIFYSIMPKLSDSHLHRDDRSEKCKELIYKSIKICVSFKYFQPSIQQILPKLAIIRQLQQENTTVNKGWYSFTKKCLLPCTKDPFPEPNLNILNRQFTKK